MLQMKELKAKWQRLEEVKEHEEKVKEETAIHQKLEVQGCLILTH